MTPIYTKAEFHLTMRCDLKCLYCNRLCFLPKPLPIPDMTLENAYDFVSQAKALDWHPHIYFEGGEPTLHTDLQEMIDIVSKIGEVTVLSNGIGKETLLNNIKNAGIDYSTQKNRSILHDQRDMFISPADYGETRTNCDLHGTGRCGISVDSLGYTVCCVGGVIDTVFGLNVRTKKLADLFDEDFMKYQTEMLCKNCGWGRGDRPNLTVVHGCKMSESWRKVTQCLD